MISPAQCGACEGSGEVLAFVSWQGEVWWDLDGQDPDEMAEQGWGGVEPVACRTCGGSGEVLVEVFPAAVRIIG